MTCHELRTCTVLNKMQNIAHHVIVIFWILDLITVFISLNPTCFIVWFVMEQQIPHTGHDEVVDCLSAPLFSINSSREVHESHISGQMLPLSITLTF